MRLRRREAPAADPGVLPDTSASGPTAVYARILDGESLWLAVTGSHEPTALRHEPTGQVIEPPNDAPADPTAAAYRWHLPPALPPLVDDADHDVFLVVTAASGTPVRAGRLPDPDPMRTPPTRDGRWQLDVRVRADGSVTVRRERRPRVAEIVAAEPDGEGGVAIVVADPAAADGARLALVDEADRVVGQVPLVASDRGLTATLTVADVPEEIGPHWFLAVADVSGADDGLVPVVRPANDSARPGHSTVLPFLWAEDAAGARSMVRLQFQQEGRVRVNRFGDDGSTP